MRTLYSWLVLALSGSALLACDSSPESTTAHLKLEPAQQEALPVLGNLDSFTLTDQEGRAFTPESLRGKVWVAAFMFTRCPTICPLMTSRMRQLQKQAQDQQLDLHLVSFSVDPEHDTPEVLAKYAKDNQVDTKTWSFITGDSEAIRETAERGFRIGVDGQAQEGAEHYGITHGTHLVLLDPQGRIRGYYQSSEPARMKELLRDVGSLLSAS